MELERPMDRLVCGDVGFGKTEVAIRAAFKAVQDGKQVAVLVPTTLLAQQHCTPSATASPVPRAGRGAVSRFLTAAQAKKVIEGWRPARSTSSSARTACSPNDVRFKDLGLLVVDEEQRFGVQHKER
jgi:transcription-repair coupling factor (superfamily II helicase)